MTLQQQVCTLEQAKRLKELGVEQRSLFHWWWFLLGGEPEIHYKGKLKKSKFLSNVQECSAFTVAELGEILPDRFYTIRVTDKRDVAKGQWHCISQRIGEGRCYGATEAEARAAMLIHLLETKVITAAEVNQ